MFLGLVAFIVISPRVWPEAAAAPVTAGDGDGDGDAPEASPALEHDGTARALDGGLLLLGLAALTLGAALVRHVNPTSLRDAQLQLVLLGAMLAGWASFTWSFARVEWDFVFDWMTTEQSLKYVGVLAPLIAARFVIPMLLFRRVFAFLFPDTEQEVRRGAFMLLAFKMFSLLAVTAGLGYHLPGTSIFLEGIQHLVITGLLMLALL